MDLEHAADQPLPSMSAASPTLGYARTASGYAHCPRAARYHPAEMRTPTWLIVVLLLAILGLGVYGYFTTPLPFGLSNVIRTPGGAAATGAPSPTMPPAGMAPGAHVVAGQPLTLGAVSVAISSVQRNQDLTAGGGRGPAGSFSVVQVEVRNGGRDPLTLRPDDFRLFDERGRSYAVDLEASRAASQAARLRNPFEASVPPGGRAALALAFETAADAGALTLRVGLGYGELELPR